MTQEVGRRLIDGVWETNVQSEGGGGGGGGGGGIQFDTSPQEGGYLEVTTTTGSVTLETTGGDDISLVSSDSVNVTGDNGININADGNGGIVLLTSGFGDVSVEAGADSGIDLIAHSPAVITVTGTLKIVGLPILEPASANTVWNDGGTLKIT
jgi:hypothetical protein